ncbi:unnamed protein product (macronuclear) [Paramecium tetraurelia]|uniref:Nucleoporin NSP1-like C-terminal domain-containing protein n=1 Tax=Paramecium tetraurelia TaxID=5888 RepID=A0BSU5_PARTE|nr:uncharacterized protein GSPATT00031844001 [Paramecium tetraurelia]CAK61612.1 unnamed protein product [Paramecium tetraurelia]|eukprot:XP_001429010.1 hypothetical protein (macronuclear) [Paramecium tetraurelia strain d4-2]
MFGNIPGTNNAPTQQQGNLTSSIFNNPAPTNNLFGQNQNPLGQQQQPQGIFGQPQQTNTFGNNQQSTGIFGQQQQQQQPLLGQQQQTLLTGQQPQTNSLLGQPQQQIPQLGQTQQPNLLGQPQQQQPLGLGQQPQQTPSTAQQQPAQPKNYTLNQINQQTKIHIENLTKAIANKEEIEKNQKNLQLIEKNSLKNIQQQQQPATTLGINSNPQQLQRTLVKGDRRNHTQKVENYYNEWNKVFLNISKKQDETHAQLIALVDQLTQQDTSFEIDEESLIDSIKQLGKELDGLERKINYVVKIQEKILGLEKEESEWDQIVNNLSECLLHLDQQTKDVEDLLLQAKKHPKVQNK